MGNITHYFLGANSGQGFRNLFHRFCEEDCHYDLMVLKGGPGAGKSTLMRKIGKAMEGKGEDVEYFYCSGDPDSLDGVYIPRIRTAVLDGTSPHVIEPRYPAAVERYVNLGQFYDIAAAKNAREEIIQHTNFCSDAYRRAYRALSAAAQMEESAYGLLIEGFDNEKLMRRTEGIITREIRGKGSGAKTQYRFMGSVTHKGDICRYDTVESICPKVYQIHDSYGFADPMLQKILYAAQGRNYGAVVCPDPEHMERVMHLLIPELGVAFLTIKGDTKCSYASYRRVHVDAMVSQTDRKHWKGRLSFLRKMAQTLRDEGIATLKEAKVAHDALEEVYRPHVDFAGLDQLATEEINRIDSYR